MQGRSEGHWKSCGDPRGGIAGKLQGSWLWGGKGKRTGIAGGVGNMGRLTDDAVKV